MNLRFTYEDLVAQLGSEEVHKGAFVLADNGVVDVEMSDDGTDVYSTVTGTKSRLYEQNIAIMTYGKSVQIEGDCTCPVGFNCKHIAAVLLHCLAEGESRPQVLERREKAVPELLAALRTPVPSAGTAVAAPSIGAATVKLSHGVSAWLDRLAAAAGQTGNPEAVTTNQHRLLYVLNHENEAVGSAPRLAHIRPVNVRLRKDGSIADPKSYNPDNAERPREHCARFVTDADYDILRDLAALKRLNRSDAADIALTGNATSQAVLLALLDSGRLRYGNPEGPQLRAGPAVPAEPRWIKTERGEQKLNFVPLNEADRFDCVLPLRPPQYVDVARGHVGAIKTDLTPQLALEIARSPEVTVSEAALVKDAMRQRFRARAADATATRASTPPGPATDTHALPLPEAPDNIETRKIPPVPHLTLIMSTAKERPLYYWYAAEARNEKSCPVPLARLSFDYAGRTIVPGSSQQFIEQLEGDRLILIPRDMAAEAQAAQRLGKFAVVPVAKMPFDVPSEHAKDFFIANGGIRSGSDSIKDIENPARYIDFSLNAVPRLVQEGWCITFADDYPYRMAEGEVEWWADIDEGSGIDWFSFELGIEFEGNRIDLVPHLAALVAQVPAQLLETAVSPEPDRRFAELCAKHKFYHRLPDGRLLTLPAERLVPMLKALLELVGPRQDRTSEGKLKLHRAEAGALAAFAGQTGVEIAWAENAQRLIQLGDRLRNGRGLVPVAAPASFLAKLRPYQDDGLAWLDFLRDSGFGGVLADDMGLGKTVQALAFLSHEKAAGRLDRPALILCPTSVLPNWQDEAARFAPELKVLPLRGLDRRESFDAIPKSDLVLSTYPLLTRDHKVLLAQDFHVAILDEAQAIKNPKAGVSKLVHGIKARHRLALTGTPLENNLGEVWSLFAFLAPGLLGDETTFRRTFRIPIEKHGDAKAQTFLSRRLKPFMLRRTKEEVATELPPKTEIIERVRLEGAQRDLYETVRALMQAKVRDEIARKGLAKSHIVFLDALLKLRQICCDPRLLRLPQARGITGSAKLERLMEMIPELVAEGRRILLFSQFTSMLALIEAELEKLKIPYVMLTGDTTDRATPVRQFQAGKVPLFLVSLKAGGTGLNLTAADTVIHYDPWWNPAVENQATDRAHRIGQDKPVFVYKLIVEEGIETAIELLKARKAALAEALFAGGAKTPLDLTEADISALFAPLDRKPERRAA